MVGLVPWWLTDGFIVYDTWGQIPGAILFLGGLLILVHSFVRFVLKEGTPAPVAPTKHLVVEGFYRYVRNPMYVAIVAIILGEALWTAQRSLFVYAAIAWAVPAAFVRLYEEPTLRAAVRGGVRDLPAACAGLDPAPQAVASAYKCAGCVADGRAWPGDGLTRPRYCCAIRARVEPEPGMTTSPRSRQPQRA